MKYEKSELNPTPVKLALFFKIEVRNLSYFAGFSEYIYVNNLLAKIFFLR